MTVCVCVFHGEPNKVVFNLQQHLDAIPQPVWNSSGGKPASVCHLWILSKPRRGFLTTFHRSAQSAALDDEDWAPMAPSCSRDAAKTLTFLLLIPEDPVQGAPLMFCLPVKRYPPSLRPTITAVVIPFLFVLIRISYFVSGRCSPHAQQRQH